jgi:hypothetical protein
VFVYWSTAGLTPKDDDNPTAPFRNEDYDATMRLRCKATGDADFGSCPAGVLRMEGGQGSVTVQPNRELEARLQGDTWILDFANGEVWEVPVAAIEGG